jgi:hypothetical protein
MRLLKELEDYRRVQRQRKWGRYSVALSGPSSRTDPYNQRAERLLPSGFLNFVLSWSIEDATQKRLGAGSKSASAKLRAIPPATGLVEAFGIRTHHRNRVPCQKKLSLNPAPEFNRVMNCQRLPNWNSERWGVNPRKHNEHRRYG